MNGPHDMGGMHCYGPINAEIDEPLFHGEWEKRAMAITVAMGFTGMWNIDASRFKRESLPPVEYLSSSYYQIWLAALEQLMLERQMITEHELETGRMSMPPVETVRPAPDPKRAAEILKIGGPTSRETSTSPRFAIGDEVQTINQQPSGHTRLPRYARGKAGKIIHINGAHVFPDSNAKGEGENPQWLYTVEFLASELFGAGSHLVTVDCWEPYLSNG
ncbi:MAG: nitrile hydratase subunit beta [Salaquimonas sp.]